MNPHTSHDRLWQKRLEALSAVWPQMIEGQTKAVHKARVASRRIREALPVVAATAPKPKVKKLKRRLRELTQSLGPIRELDVELGLLDDEGDSDHVPRSALEVVRREVAARRQALRHDLDKNPPHLKKLIKKLEKVGRGDRGRAEGKGLKADGKGLRADGKRQTADKRPAEDAWRDVLASRLLRRAKDLHSSIDAAGPLYTPDRIHGVRISTKKLRYALEIAHEAGIPTAAAIVRKLKKHQERLGKLHDLEGLLKHVREAKDLSGAGARIDALTAYADLLERECRRLHADFVEHRAALIECLDQVRYDLVPALTTPARRQARVSKAGRATKGAHGKRAV